MEACFVLILSHFYKNTGFELNRVVPMQGMCNVYAKNVYCLHCKTIQGVERYQEKPFTGNQLDVLAMKCLAHP